MRYRLATYRECKAHREWNTTCPACGRRGKFSPYIDTTTMRPVDDRTCGRCNRLSNCGYHLPPRMVKNGFIKKEERYANSPSINRGGVSGDAERIHYSRMRRACEQSQPWGSHLVTWLRTQFPRDAVAAALKRYRVGGTPDGATLWWQIDTQGRVHTGKAMLYNPLTGHRVKEQGFPVNWAHRMRLYGEPSDLVVPQCLFGLSLLNTEHTALTTDYTDFSDSLHDGSSTPQEENPSNPRNLWSNSPWSEKIGVVESEKTALIMSLVCPDRVWLATGGKANLKASMLAPLIGLEVAVYPDADALRDWYARIVEMNRTLGTRLHIPTWYYNLMDHPEAIARGLDLADILMGGGGLSMGTIDAIVPIDAIDTIDAIGSQP